MAKPSRWALILSCIGALGFSLHGFSVAPDIVPVHYGLDGLPDRWGPRVEVLLVYLGVVGGGTALWLTLPAFFRRVPPSMINLPHKEYWLAPERRAAATAKLSTWADMVGTALNLLMLALQLLLTPARAGTGSPNPAPTLVTLAFLAFTLGSCVWLARSYRLPASPTSSGLSSSSSPPG
jgi:hypothetical protein